MGIATMDVSAVFLRDITTLMPSTVRIIGSEQSMAWGVISLKIDGPMLQHGARYSLHCENDGLSMTTRLVLK